MNRQPRQLDWGLAPIPGFAGYFPLGEERVSASYGRPLRLAALGTSSSRGRT
jgi:hypothetical protein